MVRVIEVRSCGGPEVLTMADRAIGEPGAGEIRIRHEAIGLNFIDVYFRTGLYPAPSMPFVPGNEGAGVVTAVGAGVEGLRAGDRVAYVGSLGAYAEERLLPATSAIRLPDAISAETAAAAMLKGLTAEYLLFRTYPLKAGETALIHAAAGGTGLILGQWAKAIGARTIGTVGSREKAELARANGYEHVIVTGEEDFVARVKEITGGALCDVVYDGVGKATFPGSLDCLRPFGMFVSFGNASGPIEAFDIGLLSRKGSLYATRPTLFAHIASRQTYEAMAQRLFSALADGSVEIPVRSRHALADVAEAHRALEGRRTTGSTILLP